MFQYVANVYQYRVTQYYNYTTFITSELIDKKISAVNDTQHHSLFGNFNDECMVWELLVFYR